MGRITAGLLAAVFLLSACHRPYYIQEHHDQFYSVKNDKADSGFVNMLAPYKKSMDAQMQVVIGHADTTLYKAQPESTLGDFLADAQLTMAQKIDKEVIAAVANYGGIRVPYISAGEITLGKMYEMMPFDNMLVIAEVPGDVMKHFCDHIARAKGWPVSGIRFDIVGTEARNIYIDGSPLDVHKTYKIAVNDYMANGGDNCDFLVPLKKATTNIFIRDALIAYVKKREEQHQPLHPKIENRLQYGN
ncbi:MAG: 5'-nucleotidase C-terminal domain-containing protein [Bacteroidetes bacterium]|nr:5'-nucleotidase C-terminal domain-containing protein [Bacteroidota bacterium]